MRATCAYLTLLAWCLVPFAATAPVPEHFGPDNCQYTDINESGRVGCCFLHPVAHCEWEEKPSQSLHIEGRSHDDGVALLDARAPAPQDGDCDYEIKKDDGSVGCCRGLFEISYCDWTKPSDLQLEDRSDDTDGLPYGDHVYSPSELPLRGKRGEPEGESYMSYASYRIVEPKVCYASNEMRTPR